MKKSMIRGVPHFGTKVMKAANGGKAGQFVRGETREERIETARKAADLLGKKSIDDTDRYLAGPRTPEDREAWARGGRGASIGNRAFLDEIDGE